METFIIDVFIQMFIYEMVLLKLIFEVQDINEFNCKSTWFLRERIILIVLTCIFGLSWSVTESYDVKREKIPWIRAT